MEFNPRLLKIEVVKLGKWIIRGTELFKVNFQFPQYTLFIFQLIYKSLKAFLIVIWNINLHPILRDLKIKNIVSFQAYSTYT
jgi:hypothetical protein